MVLGFEPRTLELKRSHLSRNTAFRILVSFILSTYQARKRNVCRDSVSALEEMALLGAPPGGRGGKARL